MKINRITNNTNFGLRKTLNYKNVEKLLLNGLLMQTHNLPLVEVLPEEINRRVPNGVLGVNREQSNFILIKNIKDEHLAAYDLGAIDYKNPLRTLIDLHKKLVKFEEGTIAGRIYSSDVVIKSVNALRADKNQIVKEIILDKV